MGQPINVVKKPGSEPGLVRFETDRVLTGMGHERYRSADDVVDNRTVDELARRLFSTGHVQTVHVNSNVVTVEMAGDITADSPEADLLLDVIRGLHIYYDVNEEAAPGDAAEVPATS